MEGAARRARMKVSRSSASPSPAYMLNSWAHESGSSVAREPAAAARARVVLLHPARSNAAGWRAAEGLKSGKAATGAS